MATIRGWSWLVFAWTTALVELIETHLEQDPKVLLLRARALTLEALIVGIDHR
jgi:hypothetical protein